MAEEKKTATVKPAAKAVVKKAEENAVAETVKKEPVKQETVKKETVKKETAKTAPAKKAAAKKAAPAKKAAAKKAAPAKKETAKRTAVKEAISVQFAGKEYSTQELVKIAKDVWTYDLGMKAADFKSVELYVKPEESLVYYVINGNVSGNFAI